MMKEGGGGFLHQNPDTAPVVRRIVNGFIDGMTTAAICRTLNDDGVPPPRSASQWEVPSIWRLVRSRYLRGELQYRGKTVTDSDRNPIMSSAPAHGGDEIERRTAAGGDYDSELTTTKRSLAELDERYLCHGPAAERYNAV
jgi:hypothetical protein